MAVVKLSQIGASGSNFTAGDFLVAVQGGTTDVLFSLAQAQFGIIGGISGTTVTTSQPVINLAQTWNAGGVTFTGLFFNATSTASASDSILLDLQVGGSSKFAIGKFGSTFIPNSGGGGTSGYWFGTVAATPALGFEGASNQIIFTANSNQVGGFSYFASQSPGVGGVVVRPTAVLGFGASFTAPDAYFTRDAAGIIAQANSTNAQTFRVYNTFTDTSNYERGFVGWGINANEFLIGSQSLGTGTVRPIRIQTDSTNIFFTTAGANAQLQNSGGVQTFYVDKIGLDWSTGDTVLARGAAGIFKFASSQSFSANTTVATILGSVGPAGANTTVQEWLTIVNASGATRYIPCF